VIVIKDCAGRHFLSFVVEEDPIDIPAQEPSVGIDLGINTFAMLSTGEAVKPPDYSYLYHRIVQLQKGLARRKKGSRRWHKRRVPNSSNQQVRVLEASNLAFCDETFRIPVQWAGSMSIAPWQPC